MITAFHLEGLDVRRVSLELASALVTGAGRIDVREILVIRAQLRVGDATQVGFGEAAPLDGWSQETLADCAALASDAPIGARFASVRALDEVWPALSGAPSLRFGVEVALLDALSRHRQVSIARLLAAERGRIPRGSVTAQFAIGAGTTHATIEHAQSAATQGYECLKLKVGVASIDADLARIERVRERFPSMTLRLDANGAWSADAVLASLDRLDDLNIDLFEQPVPVDEFDRLVDAAGVSAVFIAPDESCSSIESARRLARDARVCAMVLKPTALGGLLPTAEIIDTARRRGARVVLSTLIESAIARSAIAHLAAAYPDIPGPHGLATGDWLATDVVDTPDDLVGARLLLRGQEGLGLAPNRKAMP